MRKILRGNELLIIFAMVGGKVFGIDIQNVVAVIDYVGMKVVPLAPRHMHSIMNYHGTIITIFDMKSYLHLEEGKPAAVQKVIYLKHPQLQTGILVDKVINIDSVWLSCIKPFAESEAHIPEVEVCQGVLVLQDDAPGVYWIDPNKIHELANTLNV